MHEASAGHCTAAIWQDDIPLQWTSQSASGGQVSLAMPQALVPHSMTQAMPAGQVVPLAPLTTHTEFPRHPPVHAAGQSARGAGGCGATRFAHHGPPAVPEMMGDPIPSAPQPAGAKMTAARPKTVERRAKDLAGRVETGRDMTEPIASGVPCIQSSLSHSGRRG